MNAEKRPTPKMSTMHGCQSGSCYISESVEGRYEILLCMQFDVPRYGMVLSSSLAAATLRFGVVWCVSTSGILRKTKTVKISPLSVLERACYITASGFTAANFYQIILSWYQLVGLQSSNRAGQKTRIYSHWNLISTSSRTWTVTTSGLTTPYCGFDQRRPISLGA